MLVSWTLPALRDLEAIGDFVAEHNPAAAHELVGNILDRTQRLLSDNPEAGRRGRVARTRDW
ncbi:ParE toxin of type II toxin-antitoxin system, parDE [Rhizobium sp. RU35A]|uniref:type II toxin-antitoxin system RelE/ParE family toxin n=1 Tax=Rhizobium sp. RU35A TaxID=1907414 RepID=UPI0009573787|nr:ParE toxin of type II toxin-antitoxin system, parDE [Rhizobium sp. RU35A]